MSSSLASARSAPPRHAPRRRALAAIGALALLHAATHGIAHAEDADPTLSYVRLTSGYWQVWRYDPIRRTHDQLTSDPVDKRYPSWKGAGALLARSNNDRIYEVDVARRRALPVLPDAWPATDPVASPDGSRIALARLRTEVSDVSSIWVMTPDGGERRSLHVGPGLRMHVAWSPDGKRLAYARTHAADRADIEVIGADGTGEGAVVRDASRNLFPAWSPDGRSLAFASDRAGSFDIWVLDLASKRARRLTDAPSLDVRPTWSPDGAEIAFATSRRGRLEIFTVSAAGGPASPLFEVPEPASDPAWRY